LYGNNNLYLFASGWPNQINTPGATQLTYITNLLQRAPWYNLVPDLSHTFVTAGYGTAFPLSRLVPSNATAGTIIPDTYVTASITPDGTFAIAYLPVSTTINVAMNQFSGSVTAVWMDPSNNTFSTVPGGPFSNSGTKSFTTPGNNSAGNPDWVLYFTGSGTGFPTPTPSPSPSPNQAPTPGSTPTTTLGDSAIEANSDNGNAGYLIVQSATLASTATLKSLSFYVTNSAGSLILGLYDATGTGGGPGKLLATTASFATVFGWNTQPVSATALAAGTYWLAYTPSSNSLAFVKTSGGQYFAAAKAFGAMPSTFPLSGASTEVVHWSFYGTVTP
jgi:Putative collagen-binding domain of a collagenase